MYEIIEYLNIYNIVNVTKLGDLFGIIVSGIVLLTFLSLIFFQVKTHLYLKNRIGSEEKKTNPIFIYLELIPILGFIFLFLNMKTQSSDINKYFEHNKIPEVVLKRDLFDSGLNFLVSGFAIVALNYIIYVVKFDFSKFVDPNYLDLLLTVIEVLWFYFMVKILLRFVRINKIFKLHEMNADKKDPKPARFINLILILFLVNIVMLSAVLNIKQLNQYKAYYAIYIGGGLNAISIETIMEIKQKKIELTNKVKEVSNKVINKIEESTAPVIENQDQVNNQVIENQMREQQSIIENVKLSTQIQSDKRILNIWKLLNTNKINLDKEYSINEKLIYNNENVIFSYINKGTQTKLHLELDNPSDEMFNDLIQEAKFSKNEKFSKILDSFKNKEKVINIYIEENLENNVMNLKIEVDYVKSKENITINMLLKDTISKNKGFFTINENNLIKINKKSNQIKSIDLSKLTSIMSISNVFNGNMYELFLFKLLNENNESLNYELTDNLNYNLLNEKTERQLVIKVDNNIFQLNGTLNIENLSNDLKEIFISLENINLNNTKSNIKKFKIDYKINEKFKPLLSKIENIKFSDEEILKDNKLLVFNKMIKALNKEYLNNDKNYFTKDSLVIKMNKEMNLFDFNKNFNIALSSNFHNNDFSIIKIKGFTSNLNQDLKSTLKDNLLALPLRTSSKKELEIEDNIMESDNKSMDLENDIQKEEVPSNAIPSNETPKMFEKPIQIMEEPNFEDTKLNKELPLDMPKFEEPTFETTQPMETLPPMVEDPSELINLPTPNHSKK